MLVTATERRRIASHLDAALVTVGIGIAAWALAFAGAGMVGTFAARFVSVCYPVADLLLLGVLIRLAFVQGRRQLSYWVLLAAVVPLFVSDGAWVVPALDNTYASGSWPDAGWMLSYVLLGGRRAPAFDGCPRRQRRAFFGDHAALAAAHHARRRGARARPGVIDRGGAPSSLGARRRSGLPRRSAARARRRPFLVDRPAARAASAGGRAVSAEAPHGARPGADRGLDRTRRDHGGDEPCIAGDARVHGRRARPDALHRGHPCRRSEPAPPARARHAPPLGLLDRQALPAQGRVGDRRTRPRGARPRRRSRHQPDRRRHRDARARGAAAPVAEDGGDRPARRRRRPRLQQPADA